MSITLNSGIFNQRIKHFTEKISDGQQLVFVTGVQNEDLIYLKSISMQNYLLGYEFPETLMCISKDKVTFITSKKKGTILESLKGGIEIEILGKENPNFDFITGDIFVISKDLKQLTGKLVTDFQEFAKSKTMNDCTQLVSEAMAIKGEDEINVIKDAANATSKIYKFYTDYIIKVIDENKRVSHNKISESLEELIIDENKRARLRLPEDVSII
jgi:nucleosome binding factor SPN SPT16 subunit